jgi:hypothetical protein
VRVLRNVATSDEYTDATTLLQPGSVRVTGEIINAAVRYQLGVGSPPEWGEESQWAPGWRALSRACDAVRVRSAAPGLPARVTVELLAEWDVP